MVVALVLAWLGIGHARAQSFPTCSTYSVVSASCSDQGAAFSAISSFATARPDLTANGWCYHVVATPAANIVQGGFYGCTGAPALATAVRTRSYGAAATCASRPNGSSSNAPFPSGGGSHLLMQSGSMDCSNGCVRTSTINADDTWTTSFASNSTCSLDNMRPICDSIGYITTYYGCQPPKTECNANQTKDPSTGKCRDACPVGMKVDALGACASESETCPPGNVKAPSGACLPGDGQCAVGEARRPNGTCGKDSDGDGVADDDDDDPDNDSEKDSFSGGDTCDSPPSCSGNPIDCGQARIQWRIDCNTRRNVNISGGACNAMPVCAGADCKAMEHTQLIMQWRTACALEKASGTGGAGADPNIAAIKDALTGTGGSVDGGAAGVPGDSWAGGAGEGSEPDKSGYGLGSSCPTIPPISVLGQTVTFDIGPLCRWAALGGKIVIALAGLACVRIIAGRAS